MIDLSPHRVEHMTPTVRAATLMNFAEVSRHFDMNPITLLRRLDIDPRALTQPDLRIPAARIVALLETAASEGRCSTFGLRMAESRRLSDFGALSLLITHQPTLREVLVTLTQYRNLLNETLALRVEETGDIVLIREDLLVTGPTGARQAYELAVGVLVRIFKALLGARWQPLSVNFMHRAPDDLSVHHRIFGREVIFDSEFNGVICLRADLDRANPTADPVMADYARGFINTLPRAGQGLLLSDVQQAVRQLLPAGHASLERVAASLGAPPRTLQRRLYEQGLEFRQILDDTRADLALNLVANAEFSLTHVSQLLGYSQSSNFTRWFHAKFGTTPSAWRKNQLAGGAKSQGL